MGEWLAVPAFIYSPVLYFSKALTPIAMACSLVVFAYPDAICAEVTALGMKLPSAPLIIPILLIYLTCSKAQIEMLFSSLKTGAPSVEKSAVGTIILMARLSMVATCSRLISLLGSKVVAEVPAVIPI